MVETYKLDLSYILEDYKSGRISEEQAINNSILKLKHHVETLKKEKGMCHRTLNRCIEICEVGQ